MCTVVVYSMICTGRIRSGKGQFLEKDESRRARWSSTNIISLCFEAYIQNKVFSIKLFFALNWII